MDYKLFKQLFKIEYEVKQYNMFKSINKITFHLIPIQLTNSH